MAFIPVTNVAEVVLNGLWAGQNVANVFAFQYAVALSESELNSLAASVATQWTNNIADETAQAYSVTSVKATDLTTASSPSVEFFPVSGNIGTVVQASVANNSSITISFTTDQRGRSFRGRLYMCGLPVTMLFNSVSVTIGTAASLAAAWTNFFSDIESARDCDHVVISRYAAGVARVAGLATQITGYFMENNLDSMRRRLEGRGS